MGKWSELSAQQKATVIKMAIGNGVSDINTIRDTYNIYAEGGEFLPPVNVESSTQNYVADGKVTTFSASQVGDALNNVYNSDLGSETTTVTPALVNIQLGNGEARTIYKNRDPEAYRYYAERAKRLQTYNANPGNELPEIVVTPSYAEGGSIHIDPSKRGTFTAAAKKHGKSVQAFASQVLAHKENYSPAMVKKANFARNAAHWHDGTTPGESQYLKVDDAYNTNTYNEAVKFYEDLGFKGKNASDLALQHTAENMQYDAGMLPGITVTPGVRRKYIIDNGIKNVHHAPLLDTPVESDYSKIAAGMIGIPLLATQLAPAIGEAGAYALELRDAFRAAHPFISAANDATWAGVGLHDALSNEGISKTKRLAKEGKTGRAVLSGIGDAANLLGTTEFVRVGSKILNPLYRSAWAYNTIPNWGYNNHLERFLNWSKGLLSGASPNINDEAKWLTTVLRKDLASDHGKSYGYLSELFAKNEGAAIEIAARGRDDASRLYNRLPLRNGYYIKNADGSYSYNLAKIEDDWKKLSGEEYFPLRYDDFYSESLATSGHHGLDVITGGGGNLTGNDFIGRVTVGNFPNEEEFAIKLIEDVQDVHPFRRKENQLSKMLQSFGLKEKEKLQRKADSLYTSIFDALNKRVDYGQTPLGKLWYNWLGGRALNKLRYSRQFRLPGTHYDKATGQVVKNNFWKWADAKMKDFELGKLTGARPFLMRTEIPTTLTYKPTLGQPQIGAGPQTVSDVLNSLKLEPSLTLGHHSDNYVIPGVIPPINRYLDSNTSINNNIILRNLSTVEHSTVGPLYPFSFEKQTPEVRYANGGMLGHQYGFGDWLKGLFTKTTTEEQPVAEPVGLDYEELRRRQAYTESGFDNTARSKSGAAGMFQIMPAVLADYNKANGTSYTEDSLTDQDTNTMIRDWYIDSLSKRPWVTKGGASDSVQFGKALAGYNYGSKKTVDALNKAKAAGVDIYNSWDWLDYMPKETRDYVNFILRNKNNSISRNDSAYKAALLLNNDVVTKLGQQALGGNLFAKGGKKRSLVQSRNAEQKFTRFTKEGEGKPMQFQPNSVLQGRPYYLYQYKPNPITGETEMSVLGPRPNVPALQNMREEIDPWGPPRQYVWDSPDHETYTAYELYNGIVPAMQILRPKLGFIEVQDAQASDVPMFFNIPKTPTYEPK